MINRSNWVSNSSSSSFIVYTVKCPYWGGKPIITHTQIQLLKKYGFKKTICTYPDRYDSSNPKLHKGAPDDILGYDVVCNQNEVIYTLLKNKIPFMASVHYDEQLYVWDGRAKEITVLHNWGAINGQLLFNGAIERDRHYKRTVAEIKKFYENFNNIDVAKFMKNEEKLQAQEKVK